jgi:hypothetical protein
MKKGSILIALLVLLTVNLTVLAQDEERDIVEMGFFGGLGIPGSGLTDWKTGSYEWVPKTGFDVGLEAGYFLRSNLVVGLNFIYTQFPVDTDTQFPNDTSGEMSGHQHRLYNPNLYVKFLFEGESNWTLYVKGHVGLENPKFSTFVENPKGNRFRELSYNPAVATGLGVGLIYYTGYYGGVFIEANYHQAFTKNAEATYQDEPYEFGENLGMFDIHAGIRILFSSGG